MSQIVSLPKNDANKTVRKNAIIENCKNYNFTQSYLPPIPMLENVPQSEAFSTKYLADRVLATAGLLENMALAKVRSVFDPFNHIDDFESLFVSLPKPISVSKWTKNTSFAEQRLSGSNPMKIRRVLGKDDLPFAISGAIAGYAPRTIEQAILDGQLFVTDYTDMAFVKGGKYRGHSKYLPTPKALFLWNNTHIDAALSQLMGLEGNGQLVPIAIQIKKDALIYTPYNSTEMDWLIAKLCVQIADANHHEMSSHLARTHFVVEPFAIATKRQFAPNHPLSILLTPHFRFLFANNQLGMQVLINKGGIVESTLAGTLEESLEIVTNSYKDWSIKNSIPGTEIKERGMDNKNQLPHYPYRDDSMLLWNAISQFVNKYLSLYYKTNQDVKDDTELQKWCDDLNDPNKGNVKDLPAIIDTLELLTEIISNLIFTSGPQHAAVNFSQYDYMAFAPNMPLAAYCPIPEPGTWKHPDDIMQLLPTREQAVAQLKTAKILSAYHYDQLGFYNAEDFKDDNAWTVIKAFQLELRGIEMTIDARNKKRITPYEFLKPSEILNSISI